MSRVNGRRPPKYVQTMNYPKPVSLTDKEIEALPLKSDVYVRMRDGRIVKGKLVSHSDWLVGCPVVDIGEESSAGIGYDGEIVAAAPQQEVLYTCPECGEQSYEDMGYGILRCCDCGERFTKTTGAAPAKDGE